MMAALAAAYSVAEMAAPLRVVFGLLIYGAVLLRDGIVGRWRIRQPMAPLFSNS